MCGMCGRGEGRERDSIIYIYVALYIQYIREMHLKKNIREISGSSPTLGDPTFLWFNMYR